MSGSHGKTSAVVEEMGVRRELQLLSRIEVDGRSIAFEHGLLLRYPGPRSATTAGTSCCYACHQTSCSALRQRRGQQHTVRGDHHYWRAADRPRPPPVLPLRPRLPAADRHLAPDLCEGAEQPNADEAVEASCCRAGRGPHRASSKAWTRPPTRWVFHDRRRPHFVS